MGVAGGWEEAHDGAWFFGLTLGADPTRWFSSVPDDFGANGGQGGPAQSGAEGGVG